MSPPRLRWICVQLGAREHYAIPRALRSIGALDELITDVWAPPGGIASRLPALAGRFHPGLAGAPIHSGGLGWIATDVFLRKWHALRGDSPWKLFMARNVLFDRRAARRIRRHLDLGRGQAREQLAVFAYSYAARTLLATAADSGCRTVLGQIDGGPFEEEIVLKEMERYPELGEKLGPAPAKYWEDWRAQCAASARIVVNSPWARECIVKAGIPPEKLVTVPLHFDQPAGNHVRRREIPAKFSSEDPLRVLFLGQICLRKGVGRLFDAVRALRNEPVEFWCAGPATVNIPNDIAASPRFKYFGIVNRDRVGEYYAESDVFILPTLSDGFAITQLEAQSFGLPIIASSRCGPVVKHGVNGLILSEPSAEAICETIRQLLLDPQRLGEMRAHSRIGSPPIEDYARNFIEAACS